MTTVEAMSAGCVPIVIAKGGQKEIITADSGVLCSSPEEIAKETISLIEHPQKLVTIKSKAQTRSQAYSTVEFSKKIKSLL